MLHGGFVEFSVVFSPPRVAFSPVSEDIFSWGKTPLVLFRPSRRGKVVGKQASDATTTMVP
jgi:hypothetical protein